MRLLVSYALISNKSLTYRILQNVKKKRATSIRQRFTIASPTNDPGDKNAPFDALFHFFRPDGVSGHVMDYGGPMNGPEDTGARCPVVEHRCFTAKIEPICTLRIEICHFSKPIVGRRGNDDLSAVGAKEEK